MTDKVTLTNLANLQNETTAVNAINANNAAITTAMDNTLSRDGTSPNSMGANLDMNSKHILNLAAPVNSLDPVRLTDIQTLTAGGSITFNNLPVGGTTGQALTKNSAANYDAGWSTLSLDDRLHALVNVKYFGAVGDGTTNDKVAIQAAIDYVSTNFSSGIVYFPPGNPYLVNTTVTVPDGVTLTGGGVGNTSIMTRADTIVLLVNGAFAQISNLTVLGKGANNDTGSFGATQPAVQMNGVSARMTHARVEGGAPCIRTTTDDIYLDDVVCDSSYGSSVVQVDGVTWMSRCKLDQNWPQSMPANGTNFAARGNSTSYAQGIVVSMVEPISGNTWYIQKMNAGSQNSGGAPPTLLNYGRDITDGSVTWRIVARNDMDVLRITANEFHGTSTDISSVGRFGVLINGAIKTFISQFIIGGQWSGSIEADTGTSLYVTQSELAVGINTSKFAVQTGGSWTGNCVVTECTFDGAIGTNCPAVDLAGGIDARIVNNYFKNCDTGVQVRGNINQFMIANNSMQSCTTGVEIQAGTNDHYVITNNLVSGSTTGVTDAGTGVHKVISGNV